MAAQEPEQFTLIPDEPKRDRPQELAMLHDKLRKEALGDHDKPRTSLPKASSKPGKTLARRVAEAIEAHGFDRCKEMLEWRAKLWSKDADQLRWSREAVWSEKSINYALSAMDAGDPGGRRPTKNPTGGSGHGAVDRWAQYSEENP